MAREWEVTTERLNRSAGLIEDKTAQYNSEWAKLYTEIENLKSAQWKGVASDTFNSRVEGFRNDFEEMSKVLTSYVAYLRNAASNYEKTEQLITDAASQLNVGN